MYTLMRIYSYVGIFCAYFKLAQTHRAGSARRNTCGSPRAGEFSLVRGIENLSFLVNINDFLVYIYSYLVYIYSSLVYIYSLYKVSKCRPGLYKGR